MADDELLQQIRKDPDLAMEYLKLFVGKFPETEHIVTATLFGKSLENYSTPEKKSIRWRKAQNLQLANSEEWQQVDVALDSVMVWCYEERQKKEEADEKLLKERGRILYYAFSIMGHTLYSPIRTFQYGLAHFMAMVRRNGTQAERDVCQNLRSNKVRWAISDILYPYANKRSNLKKQIKVMQTALKMAEDAKDENLVAKIKKTFDTISKMKPLRRFLD